MAENLILMFHRIYEPRLGYTPEKFSHFIDYLTQNFYITLPFKTLKHNKLNVILTFDDAYYDFYHFAFPILQRHNIPAVLAVSPSFIQDTTDVSIAERLNCPYPDAMFEPEYAKKSPFCTEKELKTMHDSGLIEIAAHGFAHKNLADPKTDFCEEALKSKQALELMCQDRIRGFIYPFGKVTRSRHQKILNIYDYAMRIGSALNKTWRKTLYRIDAEHFWPNNIPLSDPILNKFRRKYYLNRLRFK